MTAGRRVAVIGIDCLTPQLLFDRYQDALPGFAALRAAGPWGSLRSTVPPVTVPAWMCMATGRDPGELGVYGFRNRADRSYSALKVADASWVRLPTLWQRLSRRRRPSVVIGVPLTWPPRPIAGALVSGIPVPDGAEEITAPPELRRQLDERCAPGGYPVDVKEFRDEPPEALLARLHRLRETRFDVAEHLAATQPWDLLFMVEMGVDRLHHALWAHCHPDHPGFIPDSPHAGAIRDYYVALDRRVSRLVERLGPDTHVLVVSDHGARTMEGGLRINEWLIREGYLRLRRRPAAMRRLEPEDVDWPRTTAWADGGYYARIFLNVAGREPQGAVPPEGAAARLKELGARLEAMRGPGGRPLGNRVFAPAEVYRATHGVPPDLILYPADLAYRSNATIFPEPGPPADEAGALFAVENDTGVDGANHAQDGVVLVRPARGTAARPRRMEASIYDVAPTVLGWLGEPVPPELQGRPLPLE